MTFTSSDLPSPGPVPWLHSDRRFPRRVARPVRAFMGIEAGSGAVLLLATVVALVWANSAWRAGYDSLFHTEIAIEIGRHTIAEDLQHWINDGLMALFFLVVGMEIKQEWVTGELRDRRAAVLPACAALGGMVVPALVFAAINIGGAGSKGWGIPVATDIAFALGVVAVLGRRVPAPLKVFLLTLAVVDDIGAIAVIAIFYSESLIWAWLAAGAVTIALVVAAQRAHIRYLPVYVGLGTALWFFLFESGVHATLAGVIMGLLTPANALLPDVEEGHVSDRMPNQDDRSAARVREVEFLVRESVPPAERVTHGLHPWTAFLIIPVFALANAGVEVSAGALTSPAGVTVGVVAGLVLGKTLGITLFSWLALKFRLGVLPSGVRFGQLVGVAAIAGIGFTVSLFVAGLAFPGDEALASDAKVGVLVASVLAAVLGSVILWVTSPGGGGGPDDEDILDDEPNSSGEPADRQLATDRA